MHPRITRRLRLGLVASIGVGALMLLGSWILTFHDDWAWVGDALLNVGSSVLLFAPLLLISEWLLDKRVQQIEGRVRQTETEVGETQARLANEGPSRSSSDIAADLDEGVRGILLTEFEKDRRDFADIASIHDAKLFAQALSRAIERGLVTSVGPRVPIALSDLHLRFSPAAEGTVRLTVETATGVDAGHVGWSPGQDIAEALASVGEIAKGMPGFDGIDTFFPGQTPRQLSELLLFAAEHDPVLVGDFAVHKVIEMTDDGWVITETGLLPRSVPYYVIAEKRLDEIDWADHILNKPWPESAAFPSTLRWARPLIKTRSATDPVKPQE